MLDEPLVDLLISKNDVPFRFFSLSHLRERKSIGISIGIGIGISISISISISQVGGRVPHGRRHSPECRARLEEELRRCGDARVDRAEERFRLMEGMMKGMKEGKNTLRSTTSKLPDLLEGL